MAKPRLTDVATTALIALSMIAVTLSVLFVFWAGGVRTMTVAPAVAFVAGVIAIAISVLGIYRLIQSDRDRKRRQEEEPERHISRPQRG